MTASNAQLCSVPVIAAEEYKCVQVCTFLEYEFSGFRNGTSILYLQIFTDCRDKCGFNHAPLWHFSMQKFLNRKYAEFITRIWQSFYQYCVKPPQQEIFRTRFSANC